MFVISLLGRPTCSRDEAIWTAIDGLKITSRPSLCMAIVIHLPTLWS